MTRSPFLPLERLQPYLRFIEIVAWGLWLAFLLFSLLLPLETERRVQIIIFMLGTAAYIYLFFHQLFPRFLYRAWFHYMHLTLDTLLVFIAVRLLHLFTPMLDITMGFCVVIGALTGGRRPGLYAALLGSLMVMLNDTIDYQSIDASAMLWVFRLIIYSTLALLVWTLMDKSIGYWRDLTAVAEQQMHDAETQAREMQALHELVTAFGTSLDLHDVLSLAITETLTALKMDAALIALLDEDTQELPVVMQQGFSEQLAQQLSNSPWGLSEGLTSMAIAERKPLFSTDLAHDPHMRTAQLADAGYKAYICIPLKVGLQVFGVMSIVAYTPHDTNARELAFLEAIGEQIGLAVQRARAHSAEQSQRHLAEIFSRIAQAVSENPELNTIFNLMLAELQRLVPYQSAAIILIQDQALQMYVVRSETDGSHGAVTNISLELSHHPLLVRLAQTGKPILIQDTHHEPLWRAQPGFDDSRSWAGLPLLSQGKLIGLLSMARAEPLVIKTEDLQLLSAFASQSASAIEKVRLFQQSRRRLAQLSALNQVGQAISSALEFSQVLQTVYEQVVYLTGNRDFYIALYDETKDEVDFVFGHNQGQLRERLQRRSGDGLTEFVIRTRKPLLINSALKDFATAQGIHPHGPAACAWMGVPLMKAEKVIGVMAVQNYEHEYAYDEEDLELFKTLAGQVAIAIDNAHLYESTRRNLQEAAALYEFSKKVSQLEDWPLIAQAAVDACRAVLKFHNVGIFAYVDDPPQLVPLMLVGYAHNIPLEPLAQWLKTLGPHGLDGVIGLALHEGHAVRLGDVRTEPRYLGNTNMLSELCVPIMVQGRRLGAIDLESQELNAFNERDERFLITLSTQLAVALESARLKETERQRTVELSGLYEISQAFGALGDTHATYAVVTQRLAQIFDAAGTIILLYDKQRNEMRAQQPAHGLFESRAETFHYSLNGATVALSPADVNASLIVNDPSHLPETLQALVHQFGVSRYMSAAMYGHQGLLGTLLVANHSDNSPFTEREGQLLALFARQAVLAIENARLVENERLSHRQLVLVNQVGQRAAATLELKELFRDLVQSIRNQLHFHNVALFTLEGDQLALQAVVGGFAQVNESYQQPISTGIIGWVARERKPRRVNDVRKDTEFIDPRGIGMRSELAVPLLSRGELIGVLDVASDQTDQFSESDEVMLGTIADQVAQAIVNARLYESERQGRQQLLMVNRVARRILSINSLNLLMQELAAAVAETSNYPLVGAFLIEGQELVMRGKAGPMASAVPDGYRQSLEQGMFGLVASTGRTYVANDTANDPYYVDHIQVGVLAEIAVPLGVAGHVIGLLAIAADHTHAFHSSNVTTIETVADQVAHAIINVRFYEAEQRRANQLATISQLGREIASLLNLDELLHRSVRLIQESFNYGIVHIFLADYAQGVARLVARSDKLANLSEERTLQIGREGLIGKAIAEQKMILENNVRQNPDYLAHPSLMGIQSELVVPIRSGHKVLGALDVQDSRLNAFTQDDLFILQTLTDQLAVAIINAELHMAAEQQARTDSLTQVYNHRYFLEQLQQVVDISRLKDQSLSLIMLDIDRFKQYNDRYGHMMGDRVLQATVQAIRHNIKREDVVGRWGGEEFVIALPDTNEQEALVVAERIRKTLVNAVLRNDEEQPIEKPTVSQGIATFPQHAQSMEQLIDLADRMLYRAKAKGRDQVVLFKF